MISLPASIRLVARPLVLGLLFFTALQATERAQVTLLATTDLHGRILPYDYYADKPAEVGLAKLATLIKQARQERPDLLLLDCGDTIQGTPLAYFHNRKNNAPRDPMMLVMSTLGYASLTPGNHEYNFGRAVLEKARREATFPWISANTYRAGIDETAYEPYVVKQIGAVRVGILGLTTPAIPNWENPENYAGLEFRPLVSEAKKWVEVLRGREHVDVVVVTMHGGVEVDLATGRRAPGDFEGENAALALAQQVPGIDVMFLGHTHRDISALVVNGVLLAQAGRWGDRLVRADVTLTREGGAAWSVEAKASRSLPVRAEIPADPEVLALAEPYHRETQAWLSRPIGRTARPLEAANAHLQDSALLDLIQRAQLEAGNADVSLAANFNPRARVPAGTVTVRDIAGLYVYENTLYVLEITGAQLKAALEHSARYFLPYQEGKTPAELIDRNIPGYNFDVAEGVSYEIDLRRSIGDRIQYLMFKGAPLAPERTLRLATNNYRYNGGGGYTMFKNAKVLTRSSAEIRDLIIAWVEKHGEIPSEPSGNWRIVP
ncbi:bifunctional metallophosphatase/5'-nucleotidase [Opitutus terrae]|uniref:2',3'-cyclic-nucleotide 2'-phosphodiesterase n=1 Tax=Opitutus terrae (strain DSM 11246 / JCM 15787 / PB90-1) TaxID=452637 RepID=B1ZS51_OPITP|nr:bifunctional UDP-sugar hydrolase/5'-nucleotidase [Opitutus terrae]ACB74727.1 2',3'-cyclic-nucleotide 2'-phosphodiesterase [Opitutus terrae PB90-1]